MRGAKTCPDAILGGLDREPGGVAKSGRNALDSKSSCRGTNPARGFESHPLRHQSFLAQDRRRIDPRRQPRRQEGRGQRCDPDRTDDDHEGDRIGGRYPDQESA